MWNLVPWKSSGGNVGTLAGEPMEREFNRMRRDFDRLFARMWSGLPALDNDFFENHGGWGVDIDETDTHFIARVPAPGFEAEDFDVNISGNCLVVKAERKQSQDDKNGGSRFRYGQVQRMISLPDGVETDQIDASYHSGVLELKVPKGQASLAKRVEVRAG